MNSSRKIKNVFQGASVLRTRDLEARGVWRSQLRGLVEHELLHRVGRGLYSQKGAQISENHTMVNASKRVPHGIICLLSALRFHGLTTQSPHEVWIAIDEKARRPKVDYPAVRIARFSGAALSEGQVQHQIEGVTVRIYNPAKTVADCFKYRNKIGLDVALEALREVWRTRQYKMSDLFHYARICRVANVMRPYLESLT